uniref:Myb-like domain-containing protein n=1 Tax=Globisporangium ultimum (strain ATCC 200006 / CBS 805.95 / DAOM BR144) TaxID=431595 RepID=K3WMF0_GLOUD
MGKGKQWSLAEDTALAEAWVDAAESALPGSSEEKGGDTYWGTVHERWVERMCGSQRTVQALKNHWTSIQRAVRKFGAYVQETADTVGSRGTSPLTGSALTSAALQKYAAAEGENFELVTVWEILQKSPKWHSAKTPGSALKRSRAQKSALEGELGWTVEKRVSLSGASDAPAAQPASTITASDRRLSLPEHTVVHPAKPPAVSNKRLSLPATVVAAEEVSIVPVATPPGERLAAPVILRETAGPASAALTTSSVDHLAETQREKNDMLADQMLQTLILANAPGSKPSSEKDHYAASISKLADAQREKNELIADQMLMTMLLADSADPANRHALEQLKKKYLKRAFQKTSEQQQGAAAVPPLIPSINGNEAAI